MLYVFFDPRSVSKIGMPLLARLDMRTPFPGGRESRIPTPWGQFFSRVARRLDVHPEALRSWLQQAEIDGGKRPGTTADDKQRIIELEREVRELRRANEILKAASAYFARELDPRLPR